MAENFSLLNLMKQAAKLGRDPGGFENFLQNYQPPQASDPTMRRMMPQPEVQPFQALPFDETPRPSQVEVPDQVSSIAPNPQQGAAMLLDDERDMQGA
jgi:hypothetical protein